MGEVCLLGLKSSFGLAARALKRQLTWRKSLFQTAEVVSRELRR